MSLIGLSSDRNKTDISNLRIPSPFLPSSSTPMATGSFPASAGQSPVTILLDPFSESSQISPVLVHKLDLPCSFGKSGVQLAATNLHVPTDDGGYHSYLSFSVSYGLTSDLVLGND